MGELLTTEECEQCLCWLQQNIDAEHARAKEALNTLEPYIWDFSRAAMMEIREDAQASAPQGTLKQCEKDVDDVAIWCARLDDGQKLQKKGLTRLQKRVVALEKAPAAPDDEARELAKKIGDLLSLGDELVAEVSQLKTRIAALEESPAMPIAAEPKAESVRPTPAVKPKPKRSQPQKHAAWLADVLGLLCSFRGLKENWDNCGGSAANTASLDHAKTFAQYLANQPGRVVEPRVRLSGEGHVAFVWSRDQWTFGVDMLPTGEAEYLVSIDGKGRDEGCTGDWSTLLQYIR